MQENRHCLKQRARDSPKWYIADGSIVSPSKWHDMTVPKGPALGHNIPCLGGQWQRNCYDNCAKKIFSWSCCPCMLARTTWLRAQKEIVGWFATKGIVNSWICAWGPKTNQKHVCEIDHVWTWNIMFPCSLHDIQGRGDDTNIGVWSV